MQASNLPSKVLLPFADSGTKNTIPVASQVGITPGAASLETGFPPLTFTPLASGGVPPAGADFNGILNLITAVQQWQSAGGIFKYDSAFSTSVGGYPKGAILESSDGSTLWLCLADNNTTDPDGATPANWAPAASYGIAAITGLTNANVTLTPAQYSKSVITLSGTLTGNVQIIFPATNKEWLVANNTTGAFTVTCKTASGTGAAIAQGGQEKFYGDGTNLVQRLGNTPPAGDNTSKLTTTAFIANRIGDTGSASWRNALDNSTAQITTRPSANLSTSPQFGIVDRVASWASAGAVSAGTIGQVSTSAAGRTGFALAVTGVTLTGSAVLSWRYRMRAADAVHFKNILASFQMKVWHDVGSSVPYTIIIRKPTVADNFTSTTVINTGSPISVASGTATTIASLGVSMGDCSNGLEFEVQAACGAVTSKNFHFVEWGLEEGSVATNLPYRPIEIERVNCYQYARIITGTISGTKFLNGIVSSATTGEMTFPFSFAKTPTVTQSGMQLWDGTGSPAVTSFSGVNGFYSFSSSTVTASGGGLTVGRACSFRNNTGPSDFILFDAEL
jgi:hypothetical protein